MNKKKNMKLLLPNFLKMINKHILFGQLKVFNILI